MKTYRVGVVGASFGAKVHVPAFQAQGRFEVVAIASPSSAAAIAAERKIPQAFSSLEDMLAGAEIDVVSVSSPPFDHRNSVLSALSHGKHVLCEKPFGLSVAECEEMLAASLQAGTVCALAHEFRYLSARQAMHELVRNGHLGPLRAIEVSAVDTWLRPSGRRANSWWFQRARGGGLAGAILSHLVDQATWLAGRTPVRASGYIRTANPQREDASGPFTSDVDDGAFALIDYGDGLIAHAVADATRAVQSALLAVHGETRTAVASGKSLLDHTMFVVDEEETAELDLTPQPHAQLAAAHPNLPAFTTLLDDFAAALDGAPHALPSFADGLATQHVLAAIGYGTSA
jgi:predicted dehydrogenase